MNYYSPESLWGISRNKRVVKNNGLLERGVGFVPIPFISMATGYTTLGQKRAIKNLLLVLLL